MRWQRVCGAEVDLSGEILPGWRVIASAGYLDAKVTRDSVIAVGNRLRGVPEFSASLWATYRVARPLSGEMLGAGATRVGKREATLPILIASRAIRALTCRQTFRRETLAVGTRTEVRWRSSGREASRQLPRFISIVV